MKLQRKICIFGTKRTESVCFISGVLLLCWVVSAATAHEP